jgi:flagellar protein FliO/FliZ
MSFGAVFSSILAMVIALAFVLGLAYGFIWLLKKWQDQQSGGSGDSPNDRPIRFLRSLPLGQRERVTLIEVRGETMLIGVAAGTVTLLARWESSNDELAETSDEQPEPRAKSSRLFSLPDFPSLPKRPS